VIPGPGVGESFGKMKLEKHKNELHVRQLMFSKELCFCEGDLARDNAQ